MTTMPRPRILQRPIAAMLTVLTGLLVFTAPATAQFGSQAGFAEAFQKDFLRRDMQLFVDYLRIEDWQRPIIEVLLDDYQITFDAGTEACKDRMSNLKEEMLADPENAMEIALKPIKEWEREKKQLRTEFIENIRAQLSPLQMQRWPSLERAMRREKELPLGELPGERMNVFAVLHGMELKPADIQSIDPALLEYEVRLDEALNNRRSQMDRYQPKLQEAMVSKDYEAGLSGLRLIAEARSGVTDAHLDVIDTISRSLPQQLGMEFRAKILKRGYPDVFKPNSVDRLLEAVRAREDLTEEQNQGLDQIEAEYMVSLNESNDRLLALYRVYAKDIPVLQARQSIARRNKENVERGSTTPSQIADEQKTRTSMLEEYRMRILDLLTPEQTATIPANARFDRRGRNAEAGEGPKGVSPNRGRSPLRNRGNVHPDKQRTKGGGNVQGLTDTAAPGKPVRSSDKPTRTPS